MTGLHRERMRTRLTAASFGLALVAALFLLVWPVYSGFDGVRTTHATLLHVNGYWAIAPVGLLVVIALLPLVFRKQAIRIIATILIGGFSFISGFSIGLFLCASGRDDAARGVRGTLCEIPRHTAVRCPVSGSPTLRALSIVVEL